jgi:hypothetical protein
VPPPVRVTVSRTLPVCVELPKLVRATDLIVSALSAVLRSVIVTAPAVAFIDV